MLLFDQAARLVGERRVVVALTYFDGRSQLFVRGRAVARQDGDFPQLQANILYLLALYLVVNLLVDISYGWIDPRIRFS